jgi:thiamine transporter ThiT
LFTVQILLLAPYFRGNKTYEVTGLAHGLYAEVLSIMETELNFTTKLYQRQDGVWGLATIDKNTGKLNTSGMLTDLMSGNADMIATNLAILYDRSLAVDYLPPITTIYAGLFIRNDKLFDDMDFITYLEPLSNQLWLFIVILAFCIAAILYLIRYVIQGQDKPVSSTKINDFRCEKHILWLIGFGLFS